MGGERLFHRGQHKTVCTGGYFTATTQKRMSGRLFHCCNTKREREREREREVISLLQHEKRERERERERGYFTATTRRE